jgi:RNA polymerase sigma factor (sigma-70 family)
MLLSSVIEDIRCGDERGADILYSEVSVKARAQLMHRIDPAAVDDHVQDILMIVLAAIRKGELRDPLCVMGFVRTVTRRQIAVHIRRAIIRRKVISVDSGAPPAAPSNESPEARLAARERIDSLREILGGLCARDREILVRFYFQDQDSDAICSKMRLTPTQFRLYKSRALDKCGELSHRSPRMHSVLRTYSTRPV